MAEAALWSTVVKDEVPTYYLYDREVEKSPNDDREYRFMKLTNGMEVVLVHDANADTAATSMSVGSGYLLDPDDKPGLAHFCEHLLFMGSELYPDENDFQQILSKNNGYTNASTLPTMTKYYFSVSEDALADVLPRFAAFFHSPLFAPSSVARELHAINAEHTDNSQDDGWRFRQVENLLSKDGHVWSKFGTGNIETLLGADGLAADDRASVEPSSEDTAELVCTDAGLELRSRLVEWWTTNYCANRMYLAVLGKESVDELADMVSKLFSPVKNRALQPVVPVNEHPLGPDQRGTLVSIATTAPSFALKLAFGIEHSLAETIETDPKRHGPIGFLLRLIHRRGPGSLHSFLKQMGWTSGLYTDTEGPVAGFLTMVIVVRLTEDGFAHQEEVISAVFEYLAFLRGSDFEAWRQSERCRIAQLAYEFQEKERPVDLVNWLSSYADWHRTSPVLREHIVKYASVLDDWEDPVAESQLVHRLLDGMTLGNGRVVVAARKEDHDQLKTNLQWLEEPVYKTPYAVEKLGEALIHKTRTPSFNASFQLPAPNSFLPNDLSVEKGNTERPRIHPDLVRRSKLSSLWHKKDDTFWTPQSFVKVKISSAILSKGSYKYSALNTLFTMLVNDALGDELYDAGAAGSSLDYESHDLGGAIALSGYTDTITPLLEHILRAIRNFVVDPVRFQVMSEELQRDMDSFYLTDPGRVAAGYLRFLTERYDMAEPAEHFRGVVSSITAADVQQFVQEFFGEVSIRTLVTGNVSREKALQLEDLAEQIMGANYSTTVLTHGSLALPIGNNVFRTLNKNPQEPTSVLSYYLELGLVSEPRLVETAVLLAQLMSEPAFDILRTKEQLGYAIACQSYNRFPLQGLNIVIRGDHHPAYLEERVETFLLTMLDRLQGMPEEVFGQHSEGSEKSVRERPTNLWAEGTRIWSDIEWGVAEHSTSRVDTDVLASITKKEILDLFDKRVSPASMQRSKLSIHLCSQMLQTGGSDEILGGASGIDGGQHTVVHKPDDCLPNEQSSAASGFSFNGGNMEGGEDTAYSGPEWDSVHFIDDLCAFKNTLDIATLPDEDVL